MLGDPWGGTRWGKKETCENWGILTGGPVERNEVGGLLAKKFPGWDPLLQTVWTEHPPGLGTFLHEIRPEFLTRPGPRLP